MQRRQFIALLGGAAGPAWPFVALAQQLAASSLGSDFLQRIRNENVVAFIQGLNDAGYVDGQNALIETRIYETTLDRLPDLAHELIDLKCDVIVAGSQYAFEAVMRATSTTPIVGIDLESDPVARGWVRVRPSRRQFYGTIPRSSRAQRQTDRLLKEAVPTLSRLGVIWDSYIGEFQFLATQAAARTTGVTLHSLPIKRPGDFKDAFNRAARERIDGVVVLSSPLILEQRLHIAEWATQARLPTISLFTALPKAGGLMAYGPNLPDIYKRAANYVDRILKGTAAADMPIERPTRFELVINLKTAKALGRPSRLRCFPAPTR